MEQSLLVRIDKDSKQGGVFRYRVFGLNIFAANTTQSEPALLGLQSDPVLKFLVSLTRGHEVICLLGSPAPDNWRNQKQREGENVYIEDLLGKETSYCEVHVSYYGGTFGKQKNYGPSLLFKLSDEPLLERLSHPFLDWDALAILLYTRGNNHLNAAKGALNGFTIEAVLMDVLLQEARCVVLTQADCQYLEVYTRASNISDQLDSAIKEAEALIKHTEWYQRHQASLVWDETELCYIDRQPPHGSRHR